MARGRADEHPSFRSPGSTRAASLAGISARDVDVGVRLQADKPATGGGFYAYLVARRTGSGEYRAKLRVASSGAVYVHAVRVNGATETALGAADRTRFWIQLWISCAIRRLFFSSIIM